MSWLRIDDGYSRHPKVTALTHRDRWTWLDILCYCARYRTEGYIPENLKEFVPGATSRLISQCIEVELLDETEDGLRVHSWDEYAPKDPTGSERQAKWRRAHSAKAGSKRNENRNGQRNADVTDETVTEPSTSRVGAPAQPVPSRPGPVTSNAHVATPPKNGRENGFTEPYFARLHRACGGTDDALTKLRRAARGQSEGAIVHAYEAAQGPGVVDPLAVALSTLKKLRTVKAPVELEEEP